MKNKKYMFVVTGRCIDGDCECQQLNNMIIHRKHFYDFQPPRHEGCMCYLIPEKSFFSKIIQLGEALTNFKIAFFKGTGIEYLTKKLNNWLKKTWWGKRQWHKRYKAELKRRAGLTNKQAHECLMAGVGDYDYDEDPEDMASEEIDCWID